jgi:hypothetical protein
MSFHRRLADNGQPMSPIRVAIGDVQSSLLRDILAHMTDQDPDLELVAGSPTLKGAVARGNVDVVITDMRAEHLPEACSELFAEPNPPVVVGLAHEGREAAVCVANAGAAQLVAIIRSAVRGAREQ